MGRLSPRINLPKEKRCASDVERSTSPNLFEQFLRRDSEPVRDFGRAIEDLDDMVAQGAMKLARMSAPRVKLDAAEAGVAFGTDHVAFSHGRRLCPTMVTVPRRTRFTKTRMLARVATSVSCD